MIRLKVWITKTYHIIVKHMGKMVFATSRWQERYEITIVFNKAEHVMRVRTLFDYDCRSPLYRGKVEVTSDWPFFTDNWSCDQVAKIMGSERFILDRENGTRKKICRSATTLFTRQSSRRLIYSTWVEKNHEAIPNRRWSSFCHLETVGSKCIKNI